MGVFGDIKKKVKGTVSGGLREVGDIVEQTGVTRVPRAFGTVTRTLNKSTNDNKRRRGR